MPDLIQISGKKEEKKEEKEEKKEEQPTIEELEKRKEEISKIWAHQQMVKQNRELYARPENILYRLPLSDAQRAQIFENLMKEYEKAN